MTVTQALVAYCLAAGLLTVTPGLDTALVLRTAAVEGPRRAALAGLGVVIGCLSWGVAAALGLSVVLAASRTAFEILKWVGAGYMAWLGLQLIARPRERFDIVAPTARGSGFAWLRRGFLTNLLNPKVGIFYISFLPQFAPEGVAPAPFLLLLAAIHGLMGLAWFAGLIAATRPIAGALRRPGVMRWLDRLTGGVFIAFGLRLALERR